MDDKDIQALRALAQAATPGPWTAREAIFHEDTGEGRIFSDGDAYIIPPTGNIGPVALAAGDVEAAYIAAANPAAILSLLARVEQQQARIAELEAEQSSTAGAAKGGVTFDLSGLKRYDEVAEYDGGEFVIPMDRGDYVKFTDVQALLASSGGAQEAVRAATLDAQADAVIGFAQALVETGLAGGNAILMANGTAARIRALKTAPTPANKE